MFLTAHFVTSFPIGHPQQHPREMYLYHNGKDRGTDVLSSTMYLSSSGWSLDLPASLAPVFFPRFPCFLEWLWDGSSGRSRKTLISSFQLDQGPRFLMRLHCNHKSLFYETQKEKGNFMSLGVLQPQLIFAPKTVGGYGSRLSMYHWTACQGKLLSMLGERTQWYTWKFFRNPQVLFHHWK